MKQRQTATLLDETPLNVDELATGCAVTREWIIERVEAGILLSTPDPDPSNWSFRGRELARARRLVELERNFDANPELAGLVADLLDELQRLRVRMRRAGISIE